MFHKFNYEDYIGKVHEVSTYFSHKFYIPLQISSNKIRDCVWMQISQMTIHLISKNILIIPLFLICTVSLPKVIGIYYNTKSNILM